MNKRYHRFLETTWHLLIFVFFLVWFLQIHPLSVYDGDDWLYVYYSRKALPLWNDWNPSRVFPEIFMPLCSSVAAYVLAPLMGDYLHAMSLMHGLVVSLFLALYFWSFSRMMKRLFSLSSLGTIFSSALFLIAHFVVLRRYESDNLYLFHCWDLTCYYYYLIPAVINCCLVMWMLGNPHFSEFLDSGSPEKKGLLFLVIYLAIFSNLPDSGILAAYAGAALLGSILARVRKKTGRSAKENTFFIVVLILWAISAAFELSGGRARSGIQDSNPLVFSLKSAAYCLIQLFCRCNLTFLAVSMVIIGIAWILLILSRCNTPEDRRFLSLLRLCLLSIAAIGIYTLLLCAVVDYSYINRSEYLFGLVFYLFLLLMLAFGYLLQKQPRIFFLIPAMLCVLLTECNTMDATFLESNHSEVRPALCYEITQDMIEQVLQAEQEGLDTMVLKVPVWTQSGNWPHPDYMGNRIADSLYKHGVIHRKIDVVPVPSPECNEKYGLPLPD